PKPMAPIAGKPVLEHQIELARAHGFDDIVIFAHHKAETIQDYFGDGKKWGVRISYVIETEPLGTAGCLLAALEKLDDRFLVFYADTLIKLDLGAMLEAHVQKSADATLFIHPNDHPIDSDLVEIDGAGWVTALHPYPHEDGAFHRNLVNAALYVFEKKCLLPFADPLKKCDFGKDILPGLLKNGARIQGYRGRAYIKDMGTPERLARVTEDLESGIVAKKSGEGPVPAVFIDRDGTLNVEVNRVSKPEQLELIPGVAEAVRELNRAAIPVIVITNQPVIARGDCSEEDLRRIHDKMETVLGAGGAFINDIYYCPHHPDKGFAGERTELKIVCDCRKPAPGMFFRAAEDWNIDLKNSWFIGDTTTDIRAARNAGVRSVLVRTGHAGDDSKFPDRPDFEFQSLREAVDFIIVQPVGEAVCSQLPVEKSHHE
ncbi:MAG: HAD-IIIA family hydrolase, partial [Verrucomicrobiota bacterium]